MSAIEPVRGPATVRRHVATVRHATTSRLRESQSRTSVFIPVLLGAGVILSGLAWMVERIARATGAADVDLSHSDILAPLLVPATPLVGPAGVPPDDQRAALLSPVVAPDGL